MTKYIRTVYMSILDFLFLLLVECIAMRNVDGVANVTFCRVASAQHIPYANSHDKTHTVTATHSQHTNALDVTTPMP